MSYAGKISRVGRSAGSAGRDGNVRLPTRGGVRPGPDAGTGRPGGQAGTSRRPRGRGLVDTAAVGPVEVPDTDTDWQRIAIFAAGALLGLTVGAGAALLLAPMSGLDARRAIVRRGRRLQTRTRDAWDDLRDELRVAARRGRRKITRAARRRRWAAEDYVDERRRR